MSLLQYCYNIVSILCAETWESTRHRKVRAFNLCDPLWCIRYKGTIKYQITKSETSKQIGGKRGKKKLHIQLCSYYVCRATRIPNINRTTYKTE